MSMNGICIHILINAHVYMCGGTHIWGLTTLAWAKQVVLRHKSRGLLYIVSILYFWEWSRPYFIWEIKGTRTRDWHRAVWVLPWWPPIVLSQCQHGYNSHQWNIYTISTLHVPPLSICNCKEKLWGMCHRPACMDIWVAAYMWRGQTPPKPALFTFLVSFSTNLIIFPVLPFSNITPTNTHTHNV